MANENPVTVGEPPWLLVSVRDIREAEAALAGGCDILDIKEPKNGPLGMLPVPNIAKIVDAVRKKSKTMPISAALGELSDWEDLKRIPKLPVELTYLKIGTAKVGKDANWPERWKVVRKQFESVSKAKFQWVAVAYADWRAAGAPSPTAVVDACLDDSANKSGCVGVLFDTWAKQGRSLWEWISRADLRRHAEALHQGGRLVALAGNLTCDRLEGLPSLEPDIVAIRSAACRDGARNGIVVKEAVSAFRDCLMATVGKN
jgi:(5-formylfuran-3-yl)methyl phosphate synthase